MEQHNKLLHQARKDSAWMPMVVVGVLYIALSFFYDVHCITPNSISTPFTKDISWSYTSSTWFDACFFFVCVFTFYYFRTILKKYKANVLRIKNTAIIIVTTLCFFSIICGETEGGKQFIIKILDETMFADMLLPDYYGVVFAFWFGTLGGITIGIVFGILGVFNIAIEGVIICTLMGAMSGIVAFIELSLHKGFFYGLIYGIVLVATNIVINACGIAAIGAPLALLQKTRSMAMDRKEKSDEAYQKRLKK